jgi:hypothetical protein
MRHIEGNFLLRLLDRPREPVGPGPTKWTLQLIYIVVLYTSNESGR